MTDTVTCACGSCASCSAGSLPAAVVADPAVWRHSAVKARLLARIAGTEIDAARPLAGLGTRDDDDPAIALLDAFAGSLHILAWNSARLADDGTIARTEDRDALASLTALLGYVPRPALAATTTLAFTLETLPGAPGVATIARGTKVASVPGQNELPLTFETDAELVARAEWNALVAASPQTPVVGTSTEVTVAGVATGAKPGDLLLVQNTPQAVPAIPDWLLGRIAGVDRQGTADPQVTRLTLADTRPVIGKPGWSLAREGRAYILAQRAAPFGANAPDLRLMPDAIRTALGKPTVGALPTEWKNFEVGAPGVANAVDLDAVYPDAVVGRMVVFTPSDPSAPPVGAPSKDQVGVITSAVERARVDFGLSAKVSRIGIDGINLAPIPPGTSIIPPGSMRYTVRENAVFLQTEELVVVLPASDIMLPAATALDRITVKGDCGALPVGRRLVLTGAPWATVAGGPATVAEVATLRSATPSASGGTTELAFEAPLAQRFRSTTLVVLGNCAPASHGETPTSGAEIIGSGNAASAGSRFGLRLAPLAHVPADTPRGYAAAIEVRVGDRRYDELPTLFDAPADAHAFAIRQTPGGGAQVQFGGRLPTGTHNVTALYRTGGGTAGNLGVGRITTAMAPVMGVKSVSNPVPADGASDAETLEAMRSAAPQSIRTLDRVVSLADFEAFTRGYRGIGKALATELHAGMRSVVCLTVATTALLSPVAGSDSIERLRAALADVAVPGRRILIQGFDDLTASLTIAMAIDPALRRTDVEAAVRTLLGVRFGRPVRNFGEALHRSAVLAAVQSVPGVIAARLPVFVLPGGPAETEGRLLCPAPTLASLAGLLAINPDMVAFTEMPA